MIRSFCLMKRCHTQLGIVSLKKKASQRQMKTQRFIQRAHKATETKFRKKVQHLPTKSRIIAGN